MLSSRPCYDSGRPQSFTPSPVIELKGLSGLYCVFYPGGTSPHHHMRTQPCQGVSGCDEPHQSILTFSNNNVLMFKEDFIITIVMATQSSWKLACKKRGPREESGNNTCVGGTAQKHCHLTTPSNPGKHPEALCRVVLTTRIHSCCIRGHLQGPIPGWADTLAPEAQVAALLVLWCTQGCRDGLLGVALC